MLQGSELLGYFDQPVQVKKNGQTRISFLWASEGEQVDVCNYRCAARLLGRHALEQSPMRAAPLVGV